MQTQHISALKSTQLVTVTNLLSNRDKSVDFRSNLLPINPTLKKYAAATLLSLTALTAYAASHTITNSNFTMLSTGGEIVGGTTDVTGTFDDTKICDAMSCTDTAMTLSSPTPFFGMMWTAHDIRVFGPGSYTFDTVQGTDIAVTVGENQLASQILFDWNTRSDIDVIVLWNYDADFGLPIYGGNNKIWNLASIDGDGDGVRGIAMVDGAFPGYSSNFNLDMTPPLTSPGEPDNTAPVCNNATLNTQPDEPLSIDVANDLLSGCTDANDDPITLVSTTQPVVTNSMLADDGAGTLTYTPASSYTGSDSFDFTVTDIVTGSTTATANISVQENLGNFTMLDGNGNTMGGTNDVAFDWDQSVNTAESDTNFNMTIATDGPTAFFGSVWTAHHVRVFAPGTYSFDTGCTTPEIEATGCPAGSAAVPGATTTMTVGAGQLGMHALFDWHTTTNMDLINVWDTDAAWNNHGDTAPKNDLWLGGAGTAPAPSTIWKLVSRDVNGDGINGTPMVDGDFPGFYVNFNKGPGVIDPDSDGVFSSNDNCPVDYNPDQADSDSDNVGNVCDLFPSDPSEAFDFDGDGVGDNADAFPTNIAASVDADDDGLPDVWNAGCDVTCQNNSGLTLDADTTPNQFGFYDRTGAQLNQLYNSTNSIQVSGIHTSAPISITGGEYSIDGGAWTSVSGTVNVFSRVLLRQTSSSTGLTTVDTVLTIGGISATFSITTKAGSLDTTPNQFSYYGRTGAQLNRLYNSTNSIQVSGINAVAPISVTGGEYSIDGGAWTSASGTVSNLSRVLLRQTSAFTGNTTVDTVLTIGGVNATFSTTTKAGSLDTTPNQFSYYDRTGAQLNRLFNSTNSIQVSGINADAPISVTGGEYSIDGGTWTSASGTVSAFSRVLLRQTSAATNSTQTDTVLTIGGISATFSITTKP